MKYEDLWIVCKDCAGEGVKTVFGKAMATRGDCTSCNGRGGQVTETGEAIKRFLSTLKAKGFL